MAESIMVGVLVQKVAEIRGEITRRCHNALREAVELVSAEDIARQSMRDKGADPEDSKLRSDFIRRMQEGQNPGLAGAAYDETRHARPRAL
jgi:hypothetical protein